MVEREHALDAGVGVGRVLVAVLPDGRGVEEDLHLLPVVVGELELPLVDGEDVRRAVEPGVEPLQRGDGLAVARVEREGLAVCVDRGLLVADLLLLDGGDLDLEVRPLLRGGEEVPGPGQGGGEIAPHVLLAVELRQVAERLHVGLELEGADEGAGRLVRIAQPLEVDARDFPEDRPCGPRSTGPPRSSAPGRR